VGLLLVEEDCAAFEGLGVSIESLGVAADVEGIAARLFAALRALDMQAVDVILVRAPARGGLGDAIYDRLLRAAEGQVIRVDH
jgi:L-threonylcarbamoyladenylate synthase